MLSSKISEVLVAIFDLICKFFIKPHHQILKINKYFEGIAVLHRNNFKNQQKLMINESMLLRC
jgi:hypothetical protein